MAKYFSGTEKDYAISKGLAKAGKGRMSLAAHEAVKAAKADGMTFRGKVTVESPKRSKVPLQAADDTATVETVETEQNVYADAFIRFPADQEFTYSHEGKTYTIGNRNACMTCGYSLIGHTCNVPVVLTYHGRMPVKPKGE